MANVNANLTRNYKKMRIPDMIFLSKIWLFYTHTNWCEIDKSTGFKARTESNLENFSKQLISNPQEFTDILCNNNKTNEKKKKN
jgi:hypothetical protein